MRTLDKLDKKILSALQDNGRISNILLAEKVGLSASACLRRVQSLEENKTILGYTVLFNEKKVGLGSQILLMITLSSQGYEELKQFEQAIGEIPSVLACYLMGGDYDYLARVAVKDIEDYEHLHRTKLSKLPYVSRMQSNFAMREVLKRPNPIL